MSLRMTLEKERRSPFLRGRLLPEVQGWADAIVAAHGYVDRHLADLVERSARRPVGGGVSLDVGTVPTVETAPDEDLVAERRDVERRTAAAVEAVAVLAELRVQHEDAVRRYEAAVTSVGDVGRRHDGQRVAFREAMRRSVADGTERPEPLDRYVMDAERELADEELLDAAVALADVALSVVDRLVEVRRPGLQEVVGQHYRMFPGTPGHQEALRRYQRAGFIASLVAEPEGERASIGRFRQAAETMRRRTLEAA